MSTPIDWRRAYLEQARSDFQVYRVLRESRLPACHWLHYLQMTMEKLGKASLLASGGGRIEDLATSHLAFIKYLRLASRDRGWAQLLRFSRTGMGQYCRRLFPLADELERLNPALAAGGPNAEYPWEDSQGNVRTPAKETFRPEKYLTVQPGVRLLKLLQSFLDHFEERFG